MSSEFIGWWWREIADSLRSVNVTTTWSPSSFIFRPYEGRGPIGGSVLNFSANSWRPSRSPSRPFKMLYVRVIKKLSTVMELIFRCIGLSLIWTDKVRVNSIFLGNLSKNIVLLQCNFLSYKQDKINSSFLIVFVSAYNTSIGMFL